MCLIAILTWISKIKKEIESKEKCLCVLVNNAGIAPGKTEVKGSSEELVDKLFDGTTEQEWLDVYQTNVVGPFLMSTAFLPLLQKSTEIHKGFSGTIINISSISGHIRISQGHFAYNSSKGAAIHLNKMLASEIAKNGSKSTEYKLVPNILTHYSQSSRQLNCSWCLPFRDDYPGKQRR